MSPTSYPDSVRVDGPFGRTWDWGTPGLCVGGSVSPRRLDSVDRIPPPLGGGRDGERERGPLLSVHPYRCPLEELPRLTGSLSFHRTIPQQMVSNSLVPSSTLPPPFTCGRTRVGAESLSYTLFTTIRQRSEPLFVCRLVFRSLPSSQIN